mmetsp:Transcript_104190/g.299894  ORF Transcript_104190/g.299894 Transcript_104190/m.299894 type:complete len:163 (-) Transcript_104190:1666-2154(-)
MRVRKTDKRAQAAHGLDARAVAEVSRRRARQPPKHKQRGLANASGRPSIGFGSRLLRGPSETGLHPQSHGTHHARKTWCRAAPTQHSIRNMPFASERTALRAPELHLLSPYTPVSLAASFGQPVIARHTPMKESRDSQSGSQMITAEAMKAHAMLMKTQKAQ